MTKESKDQKSGKISLGFLEGVSLQDKINFARHLAIVIKAGVPILDGLKIIRKQTVSKSLLKIIDQLIIDINNGQLLADSLGHYRNVFGDFFISIIRVGEASGTLVDNLLYLAGEMEKSKALKTIVRSALAYPIVILIATTGIVGLLIFDIFPKVLPIFASLHAKLPLTTRIMIAGSQFLLAHGLELLVIVVAIVIIFVTAFKKVPAFAFFFYRLGFFMPVLSTFMVDMNVSSMTRILNVLLKGGIKIVEALKITGQTLDNLVYRQELEKASETVRKGEQFSDYLELNKKIFPPLVSGLIAIGENTGNLEENLMYLSEYYEKESETIAKNLTTILEPLLLLIMGSVVGFVAISIITPIYQITSSLH